MEQAERLNRLTHDVIGAAIEVHRQLGPGFLESFYEEAMVIELELRGVAFQRQAPVAVRYKGTPIGESRLDLLVDGALVVELKAISDILPIHRAQVLSYLKAGGLSLGLLINFNERVLREGITRIVLGALGTASLEPPRREL